jgi:hypothetical protein
MIINCRKDNQVPDHAYENSTYVWTVLLRRSEAWPEQIQKLLKEMSEKHAGEMIELPNNRGKIPETFLNILTQLSGVEVYTLECGAFAVNPYLKTATLTFFKASEDTVVTLAYRDEDGVVHKMSNGEAESGFNIGDYSLEGVNEVYTIIKPYPGLWALTSDDCQGLLAYYEPIEFVISPLDTPLNLLLFPSLKLVDKLAFKYAQKSDRVLVFVPLGAKNWRDKIENSNPRHILYISELQILKKSEREQLFYLIENREFIISTTTDIDTSYPKVEINTDNKLYDQNEILTIDDYVKFIVNSFQYQFPDTELSKKLGISRKSLWEKRKKYGIFKKK